MIYNYTSIARQNRVALAGHGAGGMAQMKASLSPSAIQFIGFRITGLDPRGSLVQRRSKFCKVFFQSETAPPMQKGKAARDKGPIFASMSSTVSARPWDPALAASPRVAAGLSFPLPSRRWVCCPGNRGFSFACVCRAANLRMVLSSLLPAIPHRTS